MTRLAMHAMEIRLACIMGATVVIRLAFALFN